MATQYTAGLTTGQVLTAATMNQIGAAWETYTPTVSQPTAVTATVNLARYGRIQKLVFGYVYLTVTGTGTATTRLDVSLPVTAQTSSNGFLGSGIIFDASATNLYIVAAQLTATTTASFYSDQTGTASRWGIVPNVAIANNDQIGFSFMYEAA